MLVLKRRQGQEIVIEDQTGGQVRGQIRIVVVQTGEGSCSLAFEAPRECRIRRAELPVFGDTGNTVTGSVGSSVSGSVGFDSATNLQEKFPAVDSANARSAAVSTAAVSTAAAESSAQQAAAQQVLVQKAVSRRQQVGLSSGSSLRQALLRRSHSPVPVLPDSVLSELSSAEAVLQVQS